MKLEDVDVDATILHGPEGRVAMHYDAPADLRVSIPGYQPLSRRETHARLLLEGDAFTGSIELDGDQLDALRDALATAPAGPTDDVNDEPGGDPEPGGEAES